MEVQVIVIVPAETLGVAVAGLPFVDVEAAFSTNWGAIGGTPSHSVPTLTLESLATICAAAAQIVFIRFELPCCNEARGQNKKDCLSEMHDEKNSNEWMSWQ